MAELIDWYRNEEAKSDLHPVTLAAMLHYKFVRIHPFDDGNGRVSRLLMNYVLFKYDFPPIVIKTSDKRNYLSALNRADVGDLDSFVKFIAQQLIWSLELSIKAAKGESLDEPGDLDKKIKLLKQKLNSSDEVVKITKNKTSILEIVNQNLEPLLNGISAKLGEFDCLFKSKIEYLTASGSAFGTTLEQSLEALRLQLTTKNLNLIQYIYSLKEFRKGPIPHSFAIQFSIEFHNNVYEIKSSNDDFYFSKLYHENLSELEMDLIIEKLGTSIYEQITNVIDL